ncbi:hypothetical protein Nepgr_018903 [Nepenthes gracilis]|uniref:Uncharacterized protein n=1 Tax=Nepenthes gracilis TaxID=150966 RepID=A0AAD3STX2_NEPGR|nr:hypothetical protein Nepgr_018903 [Nepenthes gracilis]
MPNGYRTADQSIQTEKRGEERRHKEGDSALHVSKNCGCRTESDAFRISTPQPYSATNISVSQLGPPLFSSPCRTTEHTGYAFVSQKLR